MNNHYGILFISYDGLTDPLGQSQVIPYLSGLSAKGYNISIVSCEKKSRYVKWNGKIKTILDLNGISWLPVNYAKWPPVFSAIYNIFKLNNAAKKIMRQRNISILHCRSTLPGIIGLALKKKFPARILFDMRGFWADERVEGGLWPQSNLLFNYIYKFIRKKESKLLTIAGHNISLTQEGKRIIEHEMCLPAKPSPVTVIPCCVDLNLFNPGNYSQQSITEKKNALKLESASYILTYLGSIGTWYMLDEMLAFFKILQQKKPGAKFLFISKEDSSTILNAAKRNKIETGSILIVAAERNEIPLLLLLADASIFFIRPGFAKKASSPTKLGESLAMGMPVICNTGVGDSDYFVDNKKTGWVVKSFDESSYQKVIAEINQANYISKDHIRKVAEQYFSLQSGVEKFAEVYQELLD